jgi:hypothetical protein
MFLMFSVAVPKVSETASATDDMQRPLLLLSPNAGHACWVKAELTLTKASKAKAEKACILNIVILFVFYECMLTDEILQILFRGGERAIGSFENQASRQFAVTDASDGSRRWSSWWVAVGGCYRWTLPSVCPSGITMHIFSPPKQRAENRM